MLRDLILASVDLYKHSTFPRCPSVQTKQVTSSNAPKHPQSQRKSEGEGIWMYIMYMIFTYIYSEYYILYFVSTVQSGHKQQTKNNTLTKNTGSLSAAL